MASSAPIPQLPHLPEVERLSPRCIRILGGNPGKFTLQGTSTYLLGTGPSRLLIDTGQGIPTWRAALSRTLASENCTISRCLLSHWHPDHVGGAADLGDLCPDASLHKYPPNPPSGEPYEGISDGQTFKVEGATLRAVHAPGHTVDHCVFVLEEEDALFAGDNMLGHGTAVFEDLGEYMASLGRMEGLFKGRAYPGHGPVIEDGPGKVREYVRHRKEREGQVLRTLGSRDGGWTVMELVEVIYKDVRKDLWEAAGKGVQQILRKLEKEGRVLCEGENWRLKEKEKEMSPL